MAKDKDNKIMAPTDASRQREQSELELREKDEQQRREKEKAERDKEKQARDKKRKQIKAKKLKAENKRIKEEVNFPFKMLFSVTVLISLLSFILIFFGLNFSIYDALLYTFYIFSFFYLGAGAVMAGIYYLIAQDKRNKYRAQLEREELAVEEEERQRKAEDLAEIEEIEREAIRSRPGSKATPAISLPEMSIEDDEDVEMPELPESSSSAFDIEEMPMDESLEFTETDEEQIPEPPRKKSENTGDESEMIDSNKNEPLDSNDEMTDEESYIAAIMGNDKKE